MPNSEHTPVAYSRVLIVWVLLPLALAPIYANAQGAFVARGAHGFMIGGDGASTDESSVYTVEAGYSFKGTIDVGLAHRWIGAPADTLGWNLTGRGLEPRLSLHVVKQGARFPLSLSATGGYAFQNLEPDRSDDPAAVDVDGRHWSVGGILHTVFALADFVGLRPWAGITYVNRTRDYTFGDDPSLTIESDDTRYVLGVQGIVMPTARSVLFIGPELRFVGGDRTVGFTGGLVFN